MDRRPEDKGKGRERTPSPVDVNRTLHEEQSMQRSSRATNNEQVSFRESGSPNSYEDQEADLKVPHATQQGEIYARKRKALDALWKQYDCAINELNKREANTGMIFRTTRKNINKEYSKALKGMKSRYDEELRNFSSPQPSEQSPSEEQGHRSWE